MSKKVRFVNFVICQCSKSSTIKFHLKFSKTDKLGTHRGGGGGTEISGELSKYSLGLFKTMDLELKIGFIRYFITFLCS